MNKTIGAVTAPGFEPAFLNVERDPEQPNQVRVTFRCASTVPGQCGITTGATFSDEQFAIFLVRCGQQL